MTQLLSRPILRVQPTEPGPARPLTLSGLFAVSWSAAVGLVICILITVGVWFSGGSGSFSGAIRVGALTWLVGNGSGLVVGSTAVTAIPLGLTLVWGWLLYRGGRWAGANSMVRSGFDLAASLGVMALAYGAIGGIVANLTDTDSAQAGPVRSVAAPALVALVCAGLGVLRGSGHGGALFGQLPDWVRASALGGLAGASVMVASGAVLVTASLLVRFTDVVEVSEQLNAGTVGSGVLALIGVAVIPNAVLSAGAFIAGPGFQVGTGTTVAPGDFTIGPLPGFPLLAALPESGASPSWVSALVLVPVLAGVVAGLVSIRRFPVYGTDQAALRGGLAGLVGGCLFGLTTYLATGALGPGRMSALGPYAAQTTLVCATAFLIGGAIAAAGWRWVGSRSLS